MGEIHLSELCTTLSPVRELTFEGLSEHCASYHVALPADFRMDYHLQTPSGESNYLGYLFSDQNEVSLTLSRFGGFDNGINIDTREFGGCSLAKEIMMLSSTLLDENVIRTKGMDRGTNSQVEVSSLLAALFFAVAGNDWLLEKAPIFEMYCDRLDVRVFGDASSSFLGEDGKVLDFALGPFPELTSLLEKIGFLSERGIDLGVIAKHYGDDVFDFNGFSGTISLPLAVNSLYSGKYSQPTINKPNSLANALSINEMSVSDMMSMMGEVFYDKFEENYLLPALDLGLIEPVGTGDSRSQKYRCTHVEEI